MMRSRMQIKSGEYSDIEKYLTDDKLKAIYMKQGNMNLIETRYQYLKEHLEVLEVELEQLESERNLG